MNNTEFDNTNSKSEENSMEQETSRESRYKEFVGLLARHDQAIRRFVRSLLPSREGVDDVMQETALECWKKFSDFAPSQSEHAMEEFIRWACVIARYKALSWQRDQARDRLVFRAKVVEQLAQSAFESLGEQNLERQAIKFCLEKMQDDQQRLVLSVYTPGQSVAQIAAESGVKARRLYSKVNLLRKRLLECVQQRLAGEIGNA